MTLDHLSYLLAIVSASSTLAGLGFAIYGYFNLRSAERIVDKKLQNRISELERMLVDRMASLQEASHKIIAAYGLSAAGDHQRAAELLEMAVEIDPKAFDGYTALAYEYWSLGKTHEAIESFHKAKNLFPERPEPQNDLARIYAQQGEYQLALKYITETLKRKPTAWKEIDNDQSFEGLRKTHHAQYNQILEQYRAKPPHG